MCGITGIFDTRGKRAIDSARIEPHERIAAASRPGRRQPAPRARLGLGHRRLSIIDVATGQQPLFNEDGTVAVVFNGEIYNYQELIPELQALGHSFRTTQRHRGDRACLGDVGRGLRRALPRHVRLRAVGPQSRHAVPGA